MIEHVIPKLVLDAARGPDQQHAHGEKKNSLEDDREKDQPRVPGQGRASGARLQMVDGLADEPGGPDLEQVGKQDGDRAEEEGGLVAFQVRQEVTQGSDG